jgi:hypothetical protein
VLAVSSFHGNTVTVHRLQPSLPVLETLSFGFHGPHHMAFVPTETGVPTALLVTEGKLELLLKHPLENAEDRGSVTVAVATLASVIFQYGVVV